MCVFANSDSNHTDRALNTEATVPGGLSNASVENCVGECNSMNFGGAGMEQQTCWCADELTPGTREIDINDCDTPCTGDSTEWCGGKDALLLYQYFGS
ncbi:hypothetical protein EI94DRAFT_1744830 [Lactarius quietus]|nr:hypothetical protein EI94DRAFT_1744830 [Lactarius quietus]